MSGDEEQKQVKFLAPSNVKEAADQRTDYGEISEELRRTLERLAFGESVSEHERITRQIENLREERTTLKRERREIDARLDELDERIDRLQHEREKHDSKESEYDGMLQTLEAGLYDGMRVWPGHGQVREAAALAEKEPEDVIDELVERNPGIPPHAFTDATENPKTWDGCSKDAAKQPRDDDRDADE